jgi:small subunit ribosomal protein S6
MRTYELMFVVDPRVADEDVVTMTQDYRHMIEAGGALEVTKEENWGRRKLAYTIDKVNEGKYILFYIQSQDGSTRLHDVEHRMRQNDKILRFLTVRTDLDLKRAGSRVAPVEPPSAGAPAGAPGASPAPAGSTAAPAPAPADTEGAPGREE